MSDRILKFQVTIYDSGNKDPNRLLQNCKVDDGKQCYSSGNEVTFTFASNWMEETSTGTVELFILATDKSHAAALVKGLPPPQRLGAGFKSIII